MDRWLIRCGAWLVVASVVALFLTWHFAFRAPIRNPLPLPPDLVALGSPEGQALLERSAHTADFGPLTGSFAPQIRREFAGVASAVTVLNALFDPSPPLTQSGFFDGAVRRVRSSVRVSLQGMSLADVRDALRERGAETALTWAWASNVDAFRTQARENLGRPGDYLVVAYSRAALRQRGGANIAPAAAYHAGSDRILLLDAAIANYPPVWVGVESLWRAMADADDAAPRGRGVVAVRAKSH